MSRSLIFVIFLLLIANNSSATPSPVAFELRTPITIPQLEAARITSLKWATDSSLLAVGYSDGVASIFNFSESTENEITSAFATPASGSSVGSVTLSPSNSFLSIGYSNGSVQIWDIENSLISTRIETTDNTIRSLEWSPNGHMLALANIEKTVVWDTVNRQVLFTSEENSVSLGWSADSAYLIMKTLRGLTCVWAVMENNSVDCVNAAHLVTLNPLGTEFATVLGTKVQRWGIATGEILSTIPTGHRAGITSITWSPDGSKIATGSGLLGDDYSVRIWDVSTDQSNFVLEGHEDTVVSLLWHPSEAKLISASFDDSVRIWDTSIGTVISVLRIPDLDDISKIAFSPNGKMLAVINRSNEVNIYDLNS